MYVLLTNMILMNHTVQQMQVKCVSTGESKRERERALMRQLSWMWEKKNINIIKYEKLHLKFVIQRDSWKNQKESERERMREREFS